MSPKISIIIPTYNGEKYIQKAIESVLNQTFKDFEVIVVDDFSKDNTVSVIEELQKKDERIKIICLNENSGGPAKPKNEGFKIAKGEYVAYLDQDDEWLKEKLEEQIKFFEDSKDKNLGLVYCGGNLVDEDNKCFSQYIPKMKDNPFPEMLLRNPIYSNSSVLIKREVIERVGERDENMKYSEDFDMWIRVAKSGYGIGVISKPLFNYFFHKNNVTKTINQILKVKDMEYLFNKNEDIYRKYNYTHIGFFRIGVMYYLAGDSKESRKFFIKSIKTNKIFLPVYFGYILSLFGDFGKRIIYFLIFLYRIAKGKRYLIFKKNN
ncbi:TPA: hypothetical protein DIC38_03600 [Candidatus Nomurabacteria bacterium]|nr:MAG: Glycosyltransferase [Parcubacteria bacterium RAAC4_OD1_1]HCY26729.1 hypothetical protein [Candidatus Nomurabacteria bacterium]